MFFLWMLYFSAQIASLAGVPVTIPANLQKLVSNKAGAN